MDKLLNIKEVSLILGVSPKTVRRLAERRKLKKYYLGRKALRFKETEIEDYVNNLSASQTNPYYTASSRIIATENLK